MLLLLIHNNNNRNNNNNNKVFGILILIFQRKRANQRKDLNKMMINLILGELHHKKARLLVNNLLVLKETLIIKLLEKQMINKVIRKNQPPIRIQVSLLLESEEK